MSQCGSSGPEGFDLPNEVSSVNLAMDNLLIASDYMWK